MNKPNGNLRIHYHNGTKEVLKVNHDVKYDDIMGYITITEPVNGSFALVSGFLPKPIEGGFGKTFGDLKLVNAAVIQKVI